MDLTDAIRNRRSIRKFTDYYVTDNEIKEILESARYAPSWANTQVWEFVVVRDRELITAVTETYSSTNPARKCSADASALIVCCAERDVSGFKDGEQRTRFAEWFMFDLGMAIQNICLTVYSLGLGTVVVGSMDHGACAKLLHMPEGREVVAVLPLGKPAVDKKTMPPRKELKSFVYLDRHGDNFGKIY